MIKIKRMIDFEDYEELAFAWENTGMPLDAIARMYLKMKKDALVMAFRLMGEDPDSFSPECKEVIDRWRNICEEQLRKVAE